MTDKEKTFQEIQNPQKPETEPEVYVGSVRNVSEDKDKDVAAKDPRRLLQFWKAFQARQEEAYKAAGISVSATKISSVKLVMGKDGKEAVKVDFVGGGGVLDTGNQAHIFRRVNRSMPRPNKLYLLMQAVRLRGWNAVMMEVDAATREALAKACARAGIQISGEKEVKSRPVMQKSSGSNSSSASSFQAKLSKQEAEKDKESTENAMKIIAAVGQIETSADKAKETRDGIFFSNGKNASEAMWRVGSKPSDRRSELHSSRQTKNANLLECRREESILLSEIKEQYTQIMSAAKQGFDERQIAVWREKYYGKDGQEGLESKITHKHETGTALTPAEAKLERVILAYGIKADPAREKLTPEQKAARAKIVISEYDGAIAKEYRSVKTRKKTICDLKMNAVKCASSDYRLKVLKSGDRRVMPMTRDRLISKSLTLLPTDIRDTTTLIESHKGLTMRLKKVKQACKDQHRANRENTDQQREQTQKEIENVAEKVATQTKRQSGKVVRSHTAGKRSRTTAPRSAGKPSQPKSPQEAAKAKSEADKKRGVAMTRFLMDQKGVQR